MGKSFRVEKERIGKKNWSSLTKRARAYRSRDKERQFPFPTTEKREERNNGRVATPTEDLFFPSFVFASSRVVLFVLESSELKARSSRGKRERERKKSADCSKREIRVQRETERDKKENVRPPFDTRGDTENAPGEPDVRGLPDREPGLGVGVERLVVVFRVFRDPPESRGARVVRAIDNDGQLE